MSQALHRIRTAQIADLTVRFKIQARAPSSRLPFFFVRQCAAVQPLPRERSENEQVGLTCSPYASTVHQWPDEGRVRTRKGRPKAGRCGRKATAEGPGRILLGMYVYASPSLAGLEEAQEASCCRSIRACGVGTPKPKTLYRQDAFDTRSASSRVRSGAHADRRRTGFQNQLAVNSGRSLRSE